MPAELTAHDGQNPVGELAEAPGPESLGERRGDHGYWYAFVDRREYGPPPFAGVRDAPGELLRLR
ncbi:hypothetical protein ACH4VM_31200 [Streptomyces sp. NPDC020792]|uniref:hypothetical protein n=1 Tax=Streptomyces sp. NPDC020792 TaxID=3365089 RepID=UPI0037A2AEED